MMAKRFKQNNPISHLEILQFLKTKTHFVFREKKKSFLRLSIFHRSPNFSGLNFAKPVLQTRTY